MQSINHVMIMGNLGGDPETFTSAAGKSWCRFNVATNYSRRNDAGEKETTATWHRVKVFGKTAELCQTYLRKGSVAIVDGYIQNAKFKKKDGTDGWSSEVVGHQVTFLSAPKSVLPSRAPNRDVPF